jgi:biopolymer transport protein ExbB
MTCAFAAAQAAPQSLFDLLVAGGPLMVPIALASVIALGLAAERWIRLSSARLGDAGAALAIVGAVRAAGPERALLVCEERPSALARVVAVGLKHASRPFLEREKLVEEAASREVGGLSKALEPLLVVHLLAPLLGLLGTVWGMIVAFGQIALSDGLGRPELLADGIQQALVTTAAGLTVAIPALLLHRWLAAKVERFARRLEETWLGVEDALAARAAGLAPGAAPGASDARP